MSACSMNRSPGRSWPLLSEGDLREVRGTKLLHFGHVFVSRSVERTREGESGDGGGGADGEGWARLRASVWGWKRGNAAGSHGGMGGWGRYREHELGGRVNGDIVSLSVISIANGMIANGRSSVLALHGGKATEICPQSPWQKFLGRVTLHCMRYNIYTPTTYVSFIL